MEQNEPKVRFPNWTAQDRQYSLSARLYNGAVSFSVFPRDRNAGRDPLARLALDKDGVALDRLIGMIDEIGKAPLGQKIPMTRTKYDPQSKTRSNQWVITLAKDNDMCYSITVTDAEKNATFTLPITVPQSILTGNEPPSKSELSARGMRLFKKWLLRAEEYAPMTVEKPNFGGARGPRPAGGGGGYQSQNRIPQQVNVAPSVAADEENLPF